MNIIRNVLLVVFSLLLSYFLSPWFVVIYQLILNESSSWMDVGSLLAHPHAYIFIVVLSLVLFGGRNKYWWIVLCSLPAFCFEIYFDFKNLYFPTLLGLLAWIIGVGILKTVKYFHQTKNKTSQNKI